MYKRQDRITPHCVVGQLTAESICGCFTSPSREASCNYGIGKDGKIALCVEEKNRSWCSSSSANDQRAVTIECASDLNAPYAMTNAVYNSLVKLCTDICKRNGKKKLLWLGDKNKTLNYSPKSDEMVLTVHRWFANKSCPGDWLYSRLGDLASKVTAALGGSSSGSVGAVLYLSLIHIFGDIRARMYVRCISKPHGIDGTYLCLSRTRDYLDPSGNTITIGAAGVRLTSESAKQDQNITSIEDDLLGQTSKIEVITGKVDQINAQKMYRTELVVDGVNIFRDKGQRRIIRCRVYSWRCV